MKRTAIPALRLAGVPFNALKTRVNAWTGTLRSALAELDGLDENRPTARFGGEPGRTQGHLYGLPDGSGIYAATAIDRLAEGSGLASGPDFPWMPPYSDGYPGTSLRWRPLTAAREASRHLQPSARRAGGPMGSATATP